MARMIDADKLLKKIRQRRDDTTAYDDFDDGVRIGYDDTIAVAEEEARRQNR